MEDVVYLRDLDGSGSMHVCAKGDPGALPYVYDGDFAGVYAVSLADQGAARRQAKELREVVEMLAKFDARNSIVHLREIARETLAGLDANPAPSPAPKR